MYFHDAHAIPILSPNPPTPPPITHLVLAQDAQLAADHLQRLTLSNPATIPHVVTAIRRHLLPHPTRFRPPSPHHAPFLLHRLVLNVPYFYRYLATPHFLRALLRLANYVPATQATRVLFAGWARDLKRMGLEQDPAAAFWIVAAEKVARKGGLPVVPAHRQFVYPVSEVEEMCMRGGNGAGGMAAADVAASMRLLEQLGAARKRRERGSVGQLGKRRKSAGKVAEEGSGPEERKGIPCRLNQKVLSVLRRHGDLVNVGKVEEEKASVAKVARDNARRKLWESHGSLSVAGMERGVRWSEAWFEEGTTSWEESRCGEEMEGVESAFTPSTFARMEVRTGGGSIGGVVSEEDMEMAIESVGDTVKLPEVEVVKGLSIGKRLMMKMMAGGKGELGDGSTVGSSSSRLLLSKRWGQSVY